MEGLRIRLRAQGQDDETIDLLFEAWETGTIKDYQVTWVRWLAHCTPTNQDPFARDELSLARFLATLVLLKLGQGSVEKTATVIRYTWSILEDPAVVCQKLGIVAGKLNRAKCKSTDLVWDLPYLHQYFDSPPGDPPSLHPSAFREHTQRAICLLKAATGWRAADLLGIYLEKSFTWMKNPNAVRIRNWGTKVRKGAWSKSVLVKELHPDFHYICTYRALANLRDLHDAYAADPNAPSIKNVNVQDVQLTPFFTWMKKKEMKRLQIGTIANYFTAAFLNNVTDSATGKQLSVDHNQHQARHAVASALNDMGVSPEAISNITLNSPMTLTSTYIVEVERHWELPLSCLANQPSLLGKLLLPYVHWKTFKARDPDALGSVDSCACSQVFGDVSSNSSVVDCEQSDE